MTPEEMAASLAAALVRHPNSGMCWTFVSPGPHGLPVRPRLLTEHANGERIYSLSSRQVSKMLRLLNAEVSPIGLEARP